MPSAFAADRTLSQSAELAPEPEPDAADDPPPADAEVAEALEVDEDAVDPLLPQAVSAASSTAAVTATVFVRDFIDTANFQ